MKKNKKKAFRLPFYAQLLSKQEMRNTSAGDTKKYPSDTDETAPVFDQAQTQKWPSDDDETTPANDQVDS